MVDEMRAERLEADNRRHFTEDKKPIELVRQQLADWTELKPARDLQTVTAHTESAMRIAADDDLIEWG